MINLLPPNIKEDINFARRNTYLVRYILLLTAVVVAIYSMLLFGRFIVQNDVKRLEEDITRKDAIINELSPIQTEAKELSGTILTIDNLLNQEIKFSQLLQEIGAVIPPGAYLEELSVSEKLDEPISLRATVKSQELAAVLRQNLEDADLFLGADIVRISNGRTNDLGEVTDYSTEIVVQLNVAKEAPTQSNTQTEPTQTEGEAQ